MLPFTNFILLVATLVIGVSLLCSSATNATAPHQLGTLKRVVFAHRHGARTSGLNISGNCYPIGCSQLTLQGAKQLENLGRKFKAVYGAQLLGTNATTKDCDWSIFNFKSVSDSCIRVVQSSMSFWHGLFGQLGGANYLGAPHLPVIDTSQGTVVNSMESWGNILHYEMFVKKRATRYAMEKYVLTSNASERIIDADTLQSIARELDGLKCDGDALLDGDCAITCCGFLRLMLPMGWLPKFPLGEKYLPQLDALRIKIMHQEFGLYDDQVLKNNFSATIGYPVALLDAMLADSQLPFSSTLKLSEFSAHDSSLMRLFSALGNFSFSYPVPGAALAFEIYERAESSTAAESRSKIVLKKNTDKNDSKVFVRGVMYSPEQHPHSGFEIRTSSYIFNCMREAEKRGAAEVYQSDVCPLADLVRYSKTRAGLGDNCAVWPPDLAAASCEPDTPLAKISGLCRQYRAACPFSACGKKMRMLNDLSCVPL